MNRSKQRYDAVVATAHFQDFTHTLNNFHPSFFCKIVKGYDGRPFELAKNRSEVRQDIVSLVKALYPTLRFDSVIVQFT